ncbi:hypothetical protein EJB05_14552 [Eragrostis curvula]|uniref:X8 domain-containing protein n=1 Tax=Eragrostis curvula TaxID=38414 RepID=A0A5J9VZI5_9POAL|nr:hypothetical protein EJB05_14552 [Eragrostis curvula]
MALPGFPVVLLALLPLLFSCTGAEASEVGVCYGRVANDLPDPASVAQLLQRNGITMVRMFDADPAVLASLANTGIKVMVALPNEGDNLTSAAASPAFALDWVRSNVAAHLPATRIHAVAVGNEVFYARPELMPRLVPAMANVHAALDALGLAGDVKVTSPLAFDVLGDPTFPPSAARFRGDLAEPVMRPMLEFLRRTGSYLAVNAYPFWAYATQPGDVSRDFALGNDVDPNPNPVVDGRTGLVYRSLLDAERDAMHAAMDAMGFGAGSVGLHVTETGYPSAGRSYSVAGVPTVAKDGSPVFSVANARAYNTNLIRRVRAGDTGTPLRPDADMDVYVFALFNENLKGAGPDDIEQNFGLFYPNMTKVYDFDFNFHGGAGGGGSDQASWCVANAAAGDARLQAALDYACANGADCSGIRSGAACFEPDTVPAHASHAFNSYYQRNRRANGACDFAGAAYVVYQQPSE